MRNLRQLFRRSGSLSSQKRRRRSEKRLAATQRRLNNELLEKRELLAGDLGLPQHNGWNAYDVNDDRQVSARDALGIINYLARDGEGEASGVSSGMFYDVNDDQRVSAADALGVINAMSTGEQVGELVELLLTARDLSDNELPIDANGDYNVEVNQEFFLEVSYDDLRLFNDRLGVFQLFTDITIDQAGVLSPVLNETQRLIIDETITSVGSTGVTFTIPEAPPGLSGALTYTSPINDFGNNAIGEVSNALQTFGYSTNQFTISTLDFGNNDLGFQIHFSDPAFGNVNLPNISVDVNESNASDDIPTQSIEFAPFLADGVTPNTDAVRFNVNTFSRTFNDNEQFYSAQNRGEFDATNGFTGVGGLGMVPLEGGGIPQLTDDGGFIEPFDAFSLRVFLNQPVTDLMIGVNPGEDPEATLLYGRDEAVPQDLVLIDEDANITINAIDAAADPTVAVSVSPAAVDEDGTGALTYTFTRSGDSTNALNVSYTVSGTATEGTDFPTQSGTVTIGAGQTSATVTIDPTDDSDVENNETIILTVTDGSNYDVGSPSAATGTINDDDAITPDPTVSVNVSPASVLEDGSGALTYTFTRSGDTAQALSVSYNVGGTATPGTDFPVQTGTVAIAAGQTTATVTINPTDDSDVEPDETVILTINDGSNYDLGSPSSATGTIQNDDVVSTDPTVAISVSPASVDEDGTNSLVYTFTRSGDSTQALSVTYSVSGTATAGSDFASQSGTVTIGAGQTTATVSIDPIDDNTVEPDETIILTVTDGSNYNVGAPSSATGTILNDDQATADPTVSISVSPASVNEDGSGTLVYTFTRSGDSTQALSVGYTVGGTATSGVDFATQSGTVTIGAGQTTATVSINPIDDSDVEPNETIILSVTDGSNYDLGSPSSATGTILNDDVATVDPTVSVSVSPSSISESGSALVYTFTRSGDSSQALTVGYSVGGSASQGSDYVSPSGSVTIGAGQTSATVSISIIDDSIDEADETVVVSVNDGSNYDVGSPSAATATILDNDLPGPGSAIISGSVFIDEVNNIAEVLLDGADPIRDGIRSSSESGLGGVAVHASGGGTTLTVFTDIHGRYSFEGLIGGTYDVSFHADPSLMITPGSSVMSQVVTVGSSGSVGGVDFGIHNLTGSAKETGDIVASSYTGLRNGDRGGSPSSRGPREGGVVSLDSSGNQNFVLVNAGFDGASFLELVLNEARDEALLTVIESSGAVRSAILSGDDINVTADGMGVQFFGGLDDHDFFDAGSETSDFANFRNAIDQILGSS